VLEQSFLRMEVHRPTAPAARVHWARSGRRSRCQNEAARRHTAAHGFGPRDSSCRCRLRMALRRLLDQASCAGLGERVPKNLCRAARRPGRPRCGAGKPADYRGWELNRERDNSGLHADAQPVWTSVLHWPGDRAAARWGSPGAHRSGAAVIQESPARASLHGDDKMASTGAVAGSRPGSCTGNRGRRKPVATPPRAHNQVRGRALRRAKRTAGTATTLAIASCPAHTPLEQIVRLMGAFAPAPIRRTP
jgi:hypothetical protein